MIRSWARAAFRFSKFYPYQSDSEDLELKPIDEAPVVQLQNPTPQDLLNLISQHASASKLSAIYQLHKTYFEPDHALLLFRILSHFLNQGEFDQDFKKDCKEMSIMIQKNLESLSNIDLTEIMYFKSKYQARGLGDIFSPIDTAKVTKIIKSRILSGAGFSLRQLINFWFDTQTLGLNPNLIKDLIKQRIGTEPITCSEVILLMKCELSRLQKKKKIDLQMLNFCLMHIEENFVFYDFNQLGNLYYYILKLKLQFLSKTVTMPAIWFKIREFFQQNLKKLDELTLRNIFSTFDETTLFVGTDLELEIKETLFKTLQQSPSSISHQLLYGFISNAGSICTKEELEALIRVLIDMPGLDGATRMGYIYEFDRTGIHWQFAEAHCEQQYSDVGLKYLRFDCQRNVDRWVDEHKERINVYLRFCLVSPARQAQEQEDFLALVRMHPLDCINELSRLWMPNEKAEEILEAAYDAYLSLGRIMDGHQALLLRGTVNARICQKLRVGFSQNRSEFHKLLFRNGAYNKHQAALLGTLLLQNMDKIATVSLLYCALTNNVILNLARENPSQLKYLTRVLRNFNQGVGLVIFCRYLQLQGVDYRECLTRSGNDMLGLYDLYRNTDVNIKMIILYILFFN